MKVMLSLGLGIIVSWALAGWGVVSEVKVVLQDSEGSDGA